MNSEFTAAYQYEPQSSAVLRSAIVVVIVIIGICVIVLLDKPVKNTVAAYIPLNRITRPLNTSVVFVCIDSLNQLENVGLGIAGDPPRYFNVPVNPTLVEASLDGFMAQKASVAGRDIYKIEFPREIPITSLSLDLRSDRIQSVFLFLEDMTGKRIWEKNVKINRGRYHRVDINV